MSEAVFARLPRFDVAPTPSDLAFGAAIEDMHDEPAEETAAPDISFEPPEPVAPDRTAELDAALSALMRETQAMKTGSRDAVLRTITGIASELFPALTEAFLAEELARELPALLEQIEDRTEISAAPEFCDALQAAVQRGAVRARDVRFKPSPHLQPGQVQIRWISGGADYDHARLLDAVQRRFAIDFMRERNASR